MYIEEITLDGFKSYATRVTVPNFDPFFNAITGLNGSGKSNILDAICFVLGITNLSQVSVTFPLGLNRGHISSVNKEMRHSLANGRCTTFPSCELLR